MQSKIPLIVAIVFGIFAFLGIGNYVKKQTVKPPTTPILVMANPKKQGQKLERADLQQASVPLVVTNNLSGFFKPNNDGILVGQELARDMKAGEIILESSLVREGLDLAAQRFSSYLKPGERAISLSIDDAGMVSKFLNVGDHVDVLANMEIPSIETRKTTIPNQGVQETEVVTYKPTTVFLFENVRILAVGSKFQDTTADKRGAGSASGNTVTIAVSPREAQILSFAFRAAKPSGGGGNGAVTFTLLLRAINDLETLPVRETVGYNDVLDITKLQDLQKIRNDKMKDDKPVEVISGGQEQK